MPPRRPASRRPWRFYLLSCSLLVLILALAGLLIAYPPVGAPTASTAHPQRRIPHTDVNPYGANFFLTQEVEEWKIIKTLEMAREAGIGWVKQQFPWEEVEPERGKFLDPRTGRSAWEKFDRIVDLCNRYGLRIIARLDRPPAWSKAENVGFPGPPDNYQDFGNYVYDFVNRYRGRVRYIQIWNEPNLWYEWGNQSPNAAQYVMLLKIAYQNAKAADPNVIVLSAPLAPTLERSDRAISELDFLDQMYRAGARPYFDILSANAFGFGWPPDDPPSADKLNFARIILLREVMERNGDAGKAIWFNEFGWNAAPADFPPERLIWQRVSEQLQADYTVRAIQESRAKWEWAGVFNIWYFRQTGEITPDRADYYFRMVDADGFVPRLVYTAVKKATAGQHVATSGHYQVSHPAVSVGPGWQWISDHRASGGLYLATATPGLTVTFTFQGDSVTLVAPRDTTSGRLRVTMDGREVLVLPRDQEGRPVVDLYNPTLRWQERIPLAVNLPNVIHTVQLTALGEANPASGGSRVAIEAFEVGSGQASRPLALAAAAGLLALILGNSLWLIREIRRAHSADQQENDPVSPS